MAKNLIQRMQQGGPAIRLEEYVPGKILEKAVADTIEYARYNRDFKEDQRRFDIEAGLKEDNLAIVQRQADSTSSFQRAQLQL